MRPRIVLVPYPAQGHVTPMLHLARALHSFGFEPILASPDFIHRRISARLGTADDRVVFASIPSGLGEDRDFFAIDGAMESHMPAHFERMLKGLELEGGVVCVVVDLLASWAIKVATQCGIPVAGFWPAMLTTYRVISAIPELIRRGFISECGIPFYHNHPDNGVEIEDEEPKLLPTQPKLSTKDLPWLVGNSSSQKYRFKFWLRTLNRANSLRWLLVNSFPEEDGQPDEPTKNSPHTYQVGPLLSSGNNNNNNLNPSMWDEDNSCIEWLAKHPPFSVIYVSFGSWVGPVSPEKIAELALALEATKRPFLWVLRDDAAWRAGLPVGYINRVAGRGKVVGWAPQEAVLAHGTVGCYLMHCGWNSTVEAIRHGKRLVCYPISGDQFVNCSYIVRVWGIGLKLDGFGRSAIEDCIERVMEGKEGEEIQARVLELKEKVIGGDGSCRAGANLQLFVDAISRRAE